VSRRLFPVVVLLAVLLASCGGGDDAPKASAQPTASTAGGAPATTTTPVTIDGVQTFQVVASHAEGPLTYPQTPPVGGAHNPVWQPCAFYDAPVPNEKAVHSLEHGAIWITYRPEVSPADLQSLGALARTRDHVLVSRWDTGLPAPIVVTAWGRQLALQSASDPRLTDFVRLYINQGPELNAPC
jgi:hypothetical protein